MESVEVKTFIAEDIEIVGSIKCSSNIHIDGKLNGDLNCTGDAILGATGNIKGNSTVNSITIMGQVNGNVVAKDKIELKSSARVMGDVRARRMVVEDGVGFVGKAEINPSVTGASRSAELKGSHEIGPDADEGSSGDHEVKSKGGIFGKK